MRLSVNHLAPLAALVLLPGCIVGGGGATDSVPIAPSNGPAADYPVVIGEPFTIGAITYTPDDKLNYDAVGYASVSDIPDTRVSAAHKTLPLPSYAEVTQLDTGKTILVRIETRGPMVNDQLIELTQGAAIQLGIGPGGNSPVRVRRVNPPESERGLLRSGGEAPLRMDTPAALLNVLKRKLTGHEPLKVPAPDEQATVPDAKPASSPIIKAVVEPKPQPAAEPAANQGNIVVQIAAFSTKERATKAGKRLGASVSKPGRYWYVRFGPFTSHKNAEAALEKARAAGYSDARIQRIK